MEPGADGLGHNHPLHQVCLLHHIHVTIVYLLCTHFDCHHNVSRVAINHNQLSLDVMNNIMYVP